MEQPANSDIYRNMIYVQSHTDILPVQPIHKGDDKLAAMLENKGYTLLRYGSQPGTENLKQWMLSICEDYEGIVAANT